MSFISRVSPFGLSSLIVCFLCLCSGFGHSGQPSRSNLVAPLCFLSRVSGNICPFFPGFSFPTQGWAAAMGYSGRLCPCPVGPSLPPCSLLVVRSGGNFRLVVSWGGLPCLHCQYDFGNGRGLLHFCSLLSVSTHSVFAATSTAVVSLRVSGVLVSPTLPSVGLGFLRWPVTLHLSPLLAFADGRSWCPGYPQVLQFSVPFRLF